MALSIGTHLGPYEILGAIGAGGMGEVYRARDTRLGRDVALKILPISRNDDEERRARFEREAQALAALNDSRIAAIYDVLDVGDHRAIVMELVAGEPLAAVIARGPIAIRTALGYAIDISHALSVAHAAGVVHRDLKPSNVVVTESGTAKVLDFGIAKLDQGDDADGDRVTAAPYTREGMVIGTFGYMSPEQAHGRPVDARTDIFSFGVLAHEMISGRRAFEGGTSAELISAVLRDTPPALRTLAPATPRSVERCVTRCLDKDPRRRYQSAADLEAALTDAREDLNAPTSAAASGPTPSAARAGSGPWLRAIGYVLGAAAIGSAGFVAATGLRPATATAPHYRPFITEGTSVTNPVWSHDGRTLAYVSQSQIFIRGIDTSQSTQVAKQAVAGSALFWSPDDAKIYFARASDGNLVSVSAGGGEPQVVRTTQDPTQQPADGGLQACISPDGGTIVVARGLTGSVGLWALDTRSGQIRPLEPPGLPRPLATVQAIAFAPDGKRFALLASATALNQARGIWIVAWPDGPATLLFGDAPFVSANSTLSWMPDGVRIVTNGFPLSGGPSRLLIGDTRAGTLTSLTEGTEETRAPDVTRDGTRIAFVANRSGLDLIQLPMDGGPPEPLVATSRAEMSSDMLASGLLAYVTDAEGTLVVRVRAGADAWPRTVGGPNMPERDRLTRPYSVRLSPDGQRMAVESYAAEHLIWIVPTAGGAPIRLDSETTDQHGPSWSPDGNWIAYRRLRNGSWELVKVPLGGGAVVRLDDSSPGGSATDWSSNQSSDQWIAQSRPDGLHLVRPDGTSSRILAGARSPLFRFSRDGSRLLTVLRDDKRRWALTTWDVASGRQLRTVALPLAASAIAQSMALSADDAHIILAVGTDMSDIWLLEKFAPPTSWWTRWLR